MMCFVFCTSTLAQEIAQTPPGIITEETWFSISNLSSAGMSTFLFFFTRGLGKFSVLLTL